MAQRSPLTLGAVHGVFRQELNGQKYLDLCPGDVIEINLYPEYVSGTFDGSVPKFPYSRSDKVRPILINRRLNHIEALYPYFTREGKNTDQSDRDVYCKEYEALTKQMLNLVFGEMDNAREKLRLPSWLDDPSAIWGYFLFQSAWSRIPDSGLFTSNSTEANDTFQTLWPKSDPSWGVVNSEAIPEFGNRKLYRPESTSGVIWAIDSMEGELNADGESKASRLEFHPPLNLYIPPGDTDGVKISQAYFPLVWSGNDTTSPTIKITFTDTPDITEHEIVNVQLIKGQHSSCDLEPIPEFPLHRLLRTEESATYPPLCGLGQAHECFGTFQCSVLEVCLGEEQTTTLYTDIDVAVRISFHDDVENTEKESNNSLDNRQKTRVLVGFDIPESSVNSPDFNKPKTTPELPDGARWVRHPTAHMPPTSSWLRQRTALMTKFMSLEDAEHIIESIRRGEDYQTEQKYECCCPQNVITNIVSRLDDLMSASKMALHLVRGGGKGDILEKLRPMSDYVPEKYKEFVQWGGNSPQYISSPNNQGSNPILGHSASVTQDKVLPSRESREETSLAMKKMCYELHQKTDTPIPEIAEIIKEQFGEDGDISESTVRKWAKEYRAKCESGKEWRERKPGRPRE